MTPVIFVLVFHLRLDVSHQVDVLFSLRGVDGLEEALQVLEGSLHHHGRIFQEFE